MPWFLMQESTQLPFSGLSLTTQYHPFYKVLVFIRYLFSRPMKYFKSLVIFHEIRLLFLFYFGEWAQLPPSSTSPSVFIFKIFFMIITSVMARSLLTKIVILHIIYHVTNDSWLTDLLGAIDFNAQASNVVIGKFDVCIVWLSLPFKAQIHRRS